MNIIISAMVQPSTFESMLITSTANNLRFSDPLPSYFQMFSVLSGLRTVPATGMMTIEYCLCSFTLWNGSITHVSETGCKKGCQTSSEVSVVRQLQPIEICQQQSPTNVSPGLPQFHNMYTIYQHSLKLSIFVSRYNICFAFVKANRHRAKSEKTPTLTDNLEIYQGLCSGLFPKSTDTHPKCKLRNPRMAQRSWIHCFISTHARNHTLADPWPQTPRAGFPFNILQL